MTMAGLLAVRLVLLVLYGLLAHLAGARHDDGLAVLALADIVLLVLMQPLLERRGGAWLALLVAVPVLWWLAHSRFAQLPLLLVPVVFMALVAWFFGRTLRAGQVPLITRMVVEMDQVTVATLAPKLARYTRGLTAAWALLLGVLALANLVLACIAVPDGILATAGITPPLTITNDQWSWVANSLNYGLIGGFFVLEFLYRERHFPGRYDSLWHFLSSMARLGPKFWRDVMR